VCGRFSLYESTSRLAERFSVDEVTTEDLPARWNVAPTQPVLAVASSKDGSTRRLGTLRWGLVPWWAKDPSIGSRFINARSETLLTSRAFRSAVETRRCLIPANGFYEWQKLEDLGGRKHSQPFYLHAADESPLALAGLWEIWRDAEGQALRTCTIITTKPNSTVAAVHDRMPVILDRQFWDRWLYPEPLTPEELEAMTLPAPEGELILDRVATLVNNVKNEGPELIGMI
jgi:putative SOS response-associated peptidase YedK